jgi:hypothetical protein
MVTAFAGRLKEAVDLGYDPRRSGYLVEKALEPAHISV